MLALQRPQWPSVLRWHQVELPAGGVASSLVFHLEMPQELACAKVHLVQLLK